MTPDSRDLIIVLSHGIDHELSSAAFTIACGGITAGLDVAMFLTSSGVDVVRRHAADTTHVKPMEPLAVLIADFMQRGGTLWACPPCVKSRGYTAAELIDGTVIAGASVMHERIKAGAATLSF